MQVSTIAPPESGSATKTDSRIGRYLAFHLGREEFAIQVLKGSGDHGNPGHYGRSPDAGVRQGRH